MYNSDWSETKESTKPRPFNRGSVRVLVAEDSPLNLQVALKQLEKLGYQADSAADGTEVMTALAKSRYDVILMDCQMPEMSGYEATWQIRDQERQHANQEESAHVYIIAMTANTQADNREKCRSAGMDDFIHKPVQLAELDAALHRALADRASQQAIEEVIDPVVIAGLRQLRISGKPDPIVEFIELFSREAPQNFDQLSAAIKARDFKAMSNAISAATALKGSAGNLGARGLAALCDEIEQAAKNGYLADAEPILERARTEFARVCRALEEIKQESAGQTENP